MDQDVGDALLLGAFDENTFFHRGQITRPNTRAELIGQFHDQAVVDAGPQRRMLQVRIIPGNGIFISRLPAWWVEDLLARIPNGSPKSSVRPKDLVSLPAVDPINYKSRCRYCTGERGSR